MLPIHRGLSVAVLLLSLVALITENACAQILITEPTVNFPNTRIVLWGSLWQSCTDPTSSACDLTITWDGASANTGPTARTDKRGEFSATLIVPPDASVGPHSILVTDKAGNKEAAPVSVVTRADYGPLPGHWYSPGSPISSGQSDTGGSDRGVAPVIYEESSGLRILWGESFIYNHPEHDNLYWYAQLIFFNSGSNDVEINCSQLTSFGENIRGTEGITSSTGGFVPADQTFCTGKSSFSVPHGAYFEGWAIFHNVPPGGEVSLQLSINGAVHASPWLDPFYRRYPQNIPYLPEPAVCPQELINLHTCTPASQPPMIPHLSTEPDGKAPNLIVLVHGCCTNPDDVSEWDRLADKMVRVITATQRNPESWEIVVWDWTSYTPTESPIEINFLEDAKDAFLAASDQGTKLANDINSAFIYHNIHMIGHSAGALLIDQASRNMIDKHKFIHLTFLDAYAPLSIIGQEQDYGSALSGYTDSYSEQYVDTGGPPGTDSYLPYALNFDVTDWKPITSQEKVGFGPYTGHEWPRWWYEESVTTPGFKYGYALSLEGNGSQNGINNVVGKWGNTASTKACTLESIANESPASCVFTVPAN
jgi:hypothetical protein